MMLDPSFLEGLAAQTPTELLRRGRGRETYRCLGPRGEHLVAKRTRTPWLARLAGKRPAKAEFDALVRLAAVGLPVPQALGLLERGDLGLVVMAEVEHSTDLRQHLAAQPGEAALWLPRVLQLTLGLHERGWYHRDLYLDHFVVGRPAPGGAERLSLLDLGRARRAVQPRQRWFIKDLAALLHSTPAAVDDRLKLRFLHEYLAARGVSSPSERRRWRERVRAKARRMAAHTPRGGTSFPAVEEASS
jgi:tRNA A-37 threonylcarbamoyl transferase component Bud32